MESPVKLPTEPHCIQQIIYHQVIEWLGLEGRDLKDHLVGIYIALWHQTYTQSSPDFLYASRYARFI